MYLALVGIGNVPGTSATDVMDLALLTQYFDTMKEIGAALKSSAVFLPHGPGAVADIASQRNPNSIKHEFEWQEHPYCLLVCHN